MEPYTLDRGFHKQYVIDGFSSMIWTERYYGDSEVELVVPATRSMIQRLPVGTFLSIDSSDEVMILESVEIDDKLKATGISLLKWMNNRFVRTSAKHEDNTWYIENQVPGQVLWTILYNMCAVGSPYLTGSIPTGIPNPQNLAIPGLALNNYDTSGIAVKVGVPFKEVYDAMREIANTYEIGMQITLDAVTDTSYTLGFRSYKGLDRTSAQTINPIIRYSPLMDSFTNIKDLESIAALKTIVYAFASENPGGLATGLAPGISALTGTQYTGFDLRAEQVLASDIQTDTVGGDATKLAGILASRANDELVKNKKVKAVDGEIVPNVEFKYGVDYFLGDIIEVQGNSGAVQPARITEYIRSQDSSGEKAYPTVAMIG